MIDGYSDGTFKPDNQVTYGAALKLIMLAAGYDEQKPVNSNVFSGYLARAQADGLVSGSVNLTPPSPGWRSARSRPRPWPQHQQPVQRPSLHRHHGPLCPGAECRRHREGYFSNGTSTFKPYNTLTRGQISAIVWRMEQAQ